MNILFNKFYILSSLRKDCYNFNQPCWLIHDSAGYLYIHTRLLGVLKQFLFEFRNDKHLVG